MEASNVEHGSGGSLEATVTAWITAFNARDMDGLLAPLDAEVALYPLRLEGIDEVYHGHAGVLEWLTQLERGGYTHHLNVTSTRLLRRDAVMAIGGVALGGRIGDTPFSGLYEFDGASVALVHHYFSRPETLARIGIIEDGALPERPPRQEPGAS